MIQPIPNLNGGGKADHTEPRMRAYALLMDAARALREASPHLRDYPLAPERYREDREEHRQRIFEIEELAASVMGESIVIAQSYDAYDARRAR